FAAGPGGGKPGILHGTFTMLLQDAHGQVRDTHSVSAGLDYPAVGPEHSDLFESGRADYRSATDKEALAAIHLLSRTEGILPALESAHALAYAVRIAPKMRRNQAILVNLSGRGDKDMETVRRAGNAR
ncbi:MAG: pyridoxal-phosphate dependent enzyme, partial [Chloroflexota bacterium]